MEEQTLQLKSFDDITRDYRHIFLSPHFDDAVYYCGGTIGVQASVGLRPLVITVCGGVPSPTIELSPFAAQVQRTMGFRSNPQIAVTSRREEDARALDYLKTDYLWLDYLDAIYRGTPAYYMEENQLVGGEVHPGDLWIDRELAEKLVALHERLPDTVWYAPLGAPHPSHHQIVSSAIHHLFHRGLNLKLYEDFPYVLQAGAPSIRPPQVVR